MGQWRAVLLIVLSSVLVATLLTGLMMWLLGVPRVVWPKGLLIAPTVALLVSSAVGWGLLDPLFELERMHAELIESARRDSLTRLYNRGYFLQRLSAEIECSRRTGRTLSLMMIDVDHFKSVNDAHGHPVGDRVLQSLAETCSALLGPDDMLARFGGEEFAVMLPDLPVPAAFELAERLRRHIGAARVAVRGGGVVKVTASIGLSTLAPHEEDWGELVDRADRALYRAKRDGRNRSDYEPLPPKRRD